LKKGQVGDQDIESRKHNGHLLHHEENGAKVLLFEGTTSGYYTYAAELLLVDYEYFDTHDRNEKNRRAVRFIFEQVGEEAYSAVEQKAPRKPDKKPDTTSRKGLVTTRDGHCEILRNLLLLKVFAQRLTGQDRISHPLWLARALLSSWGHC
jgi:hypothetical protein